MDKFKYYGELNKITEGEGELQLASGDALQVNFEIAKRRDEKLLFNAIVESNGSNGLANIIKLEGLEYIKGIDRIGREVLITNLIAKDSTTGTKTNSKIIINGYAGSCEIGSKKLEKNYQIHFHLLNLIFDGNQRNVVEKGDKISVSWPELQLEFPDFKCSIEKNKDYNTSEKILKKQGGVLNTGILKVETNQKSDFDFILEKTRKLNQLFSVARSTFINWGACKILTPGGKAIYEHHINALVRPFHGNNLINKQAEETVRFLNSAWIAYDEYEEIFDTKRFLYGYADTYMNSYIETRCLNIAALTDGISSRWAINEGRDIFLAGKVFNKQLPKLKQEIKVTLQKLFDDINESYIHVMLSKIKGFNRRPLGSKLKRLRKSFNCPITDEEIKRFVNLRNSLAHTSLFPDDVDNIKSFLFMRHFLDRIVLVVLNYSGDYLDMENMKEKPLISN